jgi:hypothetical protein
MQMVAGKTIAGAFVLFIALAATARSAEAQCTTCSPLSLPTGSLVGQDLETARKASFSLVGQATTGWVGFPNQVADNKAIETRDSARFDLFLTTAQVSALHKSGLGVDAVLPFGVLQSRTGSERRTDVSLGDAEIKPRATTLIGRSLRLTGLAGAALPTGNYTAHSGPGALGDAARAVTIGRGVFWGIAEVEARIEPVRERVALTAGAQGRVPIGEASDGFQWGPEVRSLTEVEVRPFSKMFGFAVGGELQVRGTGSQIDPFLNQRVESSNVGAKIVSITPAVRAQLDGGLFFSVTGRIPVYQDLTGLQFQQGPGVFAGAGYVFPVGVSAPAATTTTASSSKRYTVREYGAEWCEACKKLAPLLEAQRTSRNDVRIEQIDVTQWSEGELARRVPGAKALPVIEVLRDGSVIARLEGDRAFSFSDHLSQ